MQTQRSRDEKPVVIATGLGLFCSVLAIGALVLWGAHSLLELSGSTTDQLVWAVFTAAGIAMVVYLVRARTR